MGALWSCHGVGDILGTSLRWGRGHGGFVGLSWGWGRGHGGIVGLGPSQRCGDITGMGRLQGHGDIVESSWGLGTSQGHGDAMGMGRSRGCGDILGASWGRGGDGDVPGTWGHFGVGDMETRWRYRRAGDVGVSWGDVGCGVGWTPCGGSMGTSEGGGGQPGGVGDHWEMGMCPPPPRFGVTHGALLSPRLWGHHDGCHPGGGHTAPQMWDGGSRTSPPPHTLNAVTVVTPDPPPNDIR